MKHYRTIIHCAALSPAQHAHLNAIGQLESRPGHHRLRHRHPLDLERLRTELECDVNTLPPGFDPARVRLLVSDLDSTLIAMETIDELAAELGLREPVAAITARAMAGELDFAAALRERVALLEGLAEERIERVFTERMKPAIQPGAAQTLAWLKRRGITTAVVSGGFTFFTERLQKLLPIDHARACVLEIRHGYLTGKLAAPIVDRDAKVEFLTELAGRLGIALEQTVALGDGANDVPMLRHAGLGVAYHGHAIVRENAAARIDYGDWHDLRALLEAE